MITAQSIDAIRPWNYNDYLLRLKTYKSFTWFAKPEIISAPRCARFGWINIAPDTLKCESCHVEISHSIGEDSNGIEFSKKLMTSHHSSSCGWIANADSISNGNFSPESFLYFPSQTLEMKQLEFQKRFLLWIPFLQSKPSIPCIQIPQQIYQWTKLWSILSHNTSFTLSNNSSSSSTSLPIIQSSEPQSNLFEGNLIQIQFWKYLIQLISNKFQPSNDILLSSLLLSLFGWSLIQSQSITSPSTILTSSTSMYCHLCDRNVTIISEEQSSSSSSSFISNQLNPFQEHKYYCPFVASFTNKEIINQSILSLSTSQVDSVPSGYLQYIEVLLIQSIGWKETEEIMKENPDNIQWNTCLSDHKRKRTSFEQYLTSTTSINDNEIKNNEVNQIESVEIKYHKIKDVLSMITK